MEAKIVNLETLFKLPVSYRIPQFQRPYAWKQDSQWKPLWNDIAACAKRSLAGEELRPHFMGAIVLQRQFTSSGEVDKRIVVDGQQRLTTLQLLIKAIAEVFTNWNFEARAKRLIHLTTNDDSHLAEDNDNDTKIRQSNRNDQTAFQEIIRMSESSRLSSICDAFDFFKENVEAWLKEGGNPMDDDKAEALERVITKQVQIAAIDLDEEEEPHIIFETLNERGEPLTQSDRIKNTVMYRANIIDNAQDARSLWGMFDDPWWKELTKEPRLSRNHNDRFLNYWVIMENPEWTTSEEVAIKFRDLLNKKYANIDIKDVAKAIRESGTFYRAMEENSLPEMKSFLQRIKALETGVVFPVLMKLQASGVTWEKRNRAHRALESYLVRRAVCGLSSNALNLVFQGILRILENESSTNLDTVIIDQLEKQTVDNRLWPNDGMVRQILTATPLKLSQLRQKMMLEAIEANLRSDMAEEFTNAGNLTLEHIMPQKWEAHWPLPSENRHDQDSIETRNNAVKEIGNLTLVTSKLNIGLSNGPWPEKRNTLHNHSSLFLNKTLLDDVPAGTEWNESTIRERSSKLAAQVISIWPHADGI